MPEGPLINVRVSLAFGLGMVKFAAPVVKVREQVVNLYRAVEADAYLNRIAIRPAVVTRRAGHSGRKAGSPACRPLCSSTTGTADADSHNAAVRNRQNSREAKNSYHSRQIVINCQYENGNR
jgi:hypothetical protein